MRERIAATACKSRAPPRSDRPLIDAIASALREIRARELLGHLPQPRRERRILLQRARLRRVAVDEVEPRDARERRMTREIAARGRALRRLLEREAAATAAAIRRRRPAA